MAIHIRVLLLILVLAGMIFPVDSSVAKRVPREEYLKYVPLEFPKIVEQTPASQRLQLFGDPEAAGYVDVDPPDGVDDARGRLLEALAVRFAPFMIQNTVALPMDAFATMSSATQPLYLDDWDLAHERSQYLGTTSFPLAALLPPGPDGDTDTTRRQRQESSARFDQLLELYGPRDPRSPVYRGSTVSPVRDPFQVLYFEYPGNGPEDWRSYYENFTSQQLETSFRSMGRVYCHPFLNEVGGSGQEPGYELVLQFWFFYPYNDGGNNHYGDWEHINVVVSPRSLVERPLRDSEMRSLLETRDVNEAADPLVIRRVEYYFHSLVMPLDFSSPNVYLPRETWESIVKGSVEQRLGQKWIWEKIRDYAYRNDEETEINTHPVCFIGADNKGLDQLLNLPGDRNRDSHGTYPFPGLFKDIGPGGATEAVSSEFRLHEYWQDVGKGNGDKYVTYKRGGLVRYDDPTRIRMLPDWERFLGDLAGNADLQYRLGWMTLPVRFGYPAVESPFAGVVSHAETGNLAVFGPTYNAGWNGVAGMAGFGIYDPNAYPSVFPLGWQDQFKNSWGIFNLTLPTLISLPPLDFIVSGLGAPVRAAFGKDDRILYPKTTLPFRFVGIQGGMVVEGIPAEYNELFLNEAQVENLLLSLVEADSTILGGGLVGENHNETATGVSVEALFFIGSRFVSQNTLRHTDSGIETIIYTANRADGVSIAADLDMWEYAGSLRYNLATQVFQPFLKAGYGRAWYQLQNTTVDGQLLEPPTSPWFHQPTFSDLATLLPDCWHVGLGLEILLIRKYGFGIDGFDMSLKGEWGLYLNSLGIEEGTKAFGIPLGITNPTVTRSVFDFGVTVGF